MDPSQGQLAQHFGIRSLPTVKLFRHGEIQDEFGKKESAIRAMLEPYLTRQSDGLREQAARLARGHDAAIAYFSKRYFQTLQTFVCIQILCFC